MLKFLGTVEGVKTNVRTNKKDGSTWEEHFLGLSEKKQGGYCDEKIIHDIKLTKQAIDSGAYQLYEKLVGKSVEVEFFIAIRSYNDKAYMDWIVTGDGTPVSVEGKPAGNLKVA